MHKRYAYLIRSSQQMPDVKFVEITSLLPLIKFLALLQHAGSDHLSQQQVLVNNVPITKSLHQIRLVANSKLAMFLLDNSSQEMLFASHVQLI